MDRVQALLHFLTLNERDLFSRHALAMEYVKLGKDDAARQQFEQLLSLDDQYVGSYYHLGKLLERTGYSDLAIDTYRKGMKVATDLGDRHAFNELKAAMEILTD